MQDQTKTNQNSVHKMGQIISVDFSQSRHLTKVQNANEFKTPHAPAYQYSPEEFQKAQIQLADYEVLLNLAVSYFELRDQFAENQLEAVPWLAARFALQSRITGFAFLEVAAVELGDACMKFDTLLAQQALMSIEEELEKIVRDFATLNNGIC